MRARPLTVELIDQDPVRPPIPVAVVVTCHDAYLQYLQECIVSIDSQSWAAREKILAFDGCKAPAWLDGRGWEIIEGAWANPNAARNAGLSKVEGDWVVHFDADNVMPDGYLETMASCAAGVGPNTAVLYTDIQYCDEGLVPDRLRTMPEWSFWGAKPRTLADTSACWRRSAVLEAGGWDEALPCLDDYALQLRLFRAGWRGKHSHAPAVIMRFHKEAEDPGRMTAAARAGKVAEARFQVHSLAVVCLLSGRTDFAEWSKWLLAEDLPPTSALYLVDNSGDVEFAKQVAEVTEAALAGKFTSVRVWRHGEPYKAAEGEDYLVFGKHKHVADLYGMVFPCVREDWLLTVEDDVFPPAGTVRKLADAFELTPNVGAVAAAYRSPRLPDKVCVSRDKHGWGDMIAWADLDGLPEMVSIGRCGGGCTLWGTWAVQRSLPIRATEGLKGGLLFGWDTCLCQGLLAQGHSILLRTDVRCEHRFGGGS